MNQLIEQQMYEGHDYTIRTSPKTIMNEILVIDWLRAVFLPWNDNLRRSFQCESPVLLFLDGHASHVIPRVLAYVGSQTILIVQLVVHFSHISEPPDLCVFENFKFLYKKENKVKGMKEDTLKIYRAIAAFCKATIILIVRWSFTFAESLLNPEDLFAPLTVNPQIVLARIAIPEIPIE
jgi:hypothetical protein